MQEAADPAQLSVAEHSEPAHTPQAPQAEYDQLRALLLAPEQAQLARLKQALQKRRALSPAEVGDLLPQAVQHAAQRDTRPLADALFPVMGPALAKAVRSALGEMMQALNQVAATSLSLRAWAWRWEALRTGRSFAEVALLRSLVFRVEQVFLIHRKSGLLLAHVGSAAQDTDMVSGMLTAIQDFVNDSFAAGEGSLLDELQAGEHRILIEQGPHAFVAAVIRGIAPPATIRDPLRALLSTVHAEHASELAQFADDGDAAAFLALAPLLSACLLEQRLSPPVSARRGRFALLAVLALLLIGLGVWSAKAWSEHQHFSRYLEDLASRPGLVVMRIQTQGGTRTIHGLRDPLADDPDRLPHPAGVAFSFLPYQSLAPTLVLARARTLLRPPDSVQLSLDGATLVVSGSARHRFWLDVDRLAPLLPGVQAVKRRAGVDEDQLALDRSRSALSALLVHFQSGESLLSASEEGVLTAALSAMQALRRAGRELGCEVRFTVVGRADSQGTEEQNQRLSQLRAEAVTAALSARGLPADLLHARGVGTQAPLRSATEHGDAENRSVSFEAVVEATVAAERDPL
jgi:OOP family OmpA-OmpF porin